MEIQQSEIAPISFLLHPVDNPGTGNEYAGSLLLRKTIFVLLRKTLIKKAPQQCYAMTLLCWNCFYFNVTNFWFAEEKFDFVADAGW